MTVPKNPEKSALTSDNRPPPNSNLWQSPWYSYGLVGFLGLLLILQWVFFPVYTAANRDVAFESRPTASAKDRALEIQRQAKNATDQEEFFKLAENARNIQISRQTPSPTQPHLETARSTSTPKPAPPVIGSQWGKESQPALRKFSKWADRYADTPEGQRQAMVAEGIQLAEQRQEVMSELIQNNPEMAIASAMPVWRAGEIPLAVRELVEKRIAGIGDLDVMGITPSPGAKVYVKPIERVAHFGFESYQATVYGRLATVGSQSDISMHGVVIDNHIALMDSPIRLIEPGETLPEKEFSASTTHPINRMLANRGKLPILGEVNTEPTKFEYAESGDELYCLHCAGSDGWQGLMNEVGNQELNTINSSDKIPRAFQSEGTDKKMLLILVDFLDLPGGVVDESTARSRCNEINDYFKATSYNKFSFETMDITPVLRMPFSAEYYREDPSGVERYPELAEDAISAAAASGKDINSYEFVSIAFNKIYDYWAGRGSIGQADSNYPFAVTWLNGYEINVGTFAHEIGHNIGLYHAGAWDPSSNSKADDSIGTHVEYGNKFDLMGGGASRYYDLPKIPFTTHFKSLLGWVSDTNIRNVNSSYTGRIYAADQSLISGRDYAIRIDANRELGTGTKKQSNLDYWIEYRSLITENNYSQNGALIYLSDPDGTSTSAGSACRILDMNPSTTTIEDAPLQNGSSFTDADNRWKIEITGKGGFGADSYLDVEITDLMLPQITTQPPSTQKVMKGASVTLNASVSGTNLSYQWQKKSANGTWVNIEGATAASLTLSGLTMENAGKYRVAITNSYGTVYSGESILVVNTAQAGDKLWEFETGGYVYSSPAIGSDGTVYVGSWDKKLYALSGKTGDKLWEFETGGLVSTSPAIDSDGTVYVGSLDKKFYALKTDSKGPAKSPWPMRGQNAQRTGRAPAKK